MRIRNWLRGARVHVLRVQRGDIVALTIEGSMTRQQAESIKESWERRFPDTRVVVMSEGLHPSGVIRPGAPVTTRPDPFLTEGAMSERRRLLPTRPDPGVPDRKA